MEKINKMYKCEVIEVTTPTPSTSSNENGTIDETGGGTTSTEDGTATSPSSSSTTAPTDRPTERPPNPTGVYPVLEFLGGLYQMWNTGK